MVSGFFSRSKQPRDDSVSEGAKATPRTPADPGGSTRQSDADVATDNQLATTIGRWRDQLREYTDAALDAEHCPRLDLTYAHPGGSAQLYAQRPTLLSSLVREPRAGARAHETARALIEHLKSSTAGEAAPTHLAIGTVVNGSKDAITPVLLREIRFTERDDDIFLQLGNTVVVAPGLREIFEQAGRSLDQENLVESTRQGAVFSPASALGRVRRLLREIDPTYDVNDTLEAGQFLHPAQDLIAELDEINAMLSSKVVRAFAGDEQSVKTLERELPAPDPADRDPWRERGIGNQLPEQLDQIEAVANGYDLALDVSGGANPAPTIASILADAVKNHKRVLYVGSGKERCTPVWKALAGAGLGHLAARLDGTSRSYATLVEAVSVALDDNRLFSDREQIEVTRTQLRRVRQALSAHIEKLHQRFDPWGVSPYDALQVLTDLTTSRPGPRTKIRFNAQTLTRLSQDRDDEAKTALRLASEAGMFSRSGMQDPWFGVVISSPEQVRPVVAQVEKLAGFDLEKLRIQMTTTAGQTGLDPAHTFAQWEEQLQMLEGVREALDIFQPAIFERSPADMVIATASKQWRRENGVEMKRSTRNRLTKQAKDLVRPGRHVENLHEELRTVQKQREVWRRHCEAGGWPKLPVNLDEMIEHAQRVRESLNKLNPHLGTAYGNLAKLDMAELARIVERLNHDHAGASHLPQRIDVLKTLHRFGLDALVKDLRQRNVPTSLVEKELDLAWWASALGVMLSEEPSLGGFDPSSLQELIREFRALDAAHVESLAAVTADAVRRKLADVRARHYEEERKLQGKLQRLQQVAEDGPLPGQALDFYHAYALVKQLLPITITVPTMVPRIAPVGERFDLVVVDRADSLLWGQLAPLLARGRQVVVTYDSGSDNEISTIIDQVLPAYRITPEITRVNDYVGNLFSTYRLAHSGAAVPAPRSRSKLAIHYADGRGMPAPGAAAVESTVAEVEAVVDLVVEHALTRPEESLAVACLNELHAQHVKDQLRAVIHQSPALEEFFTADRAEPFTVVSPRQLSRSQRDHVILSVGFAKTPHGRAMHNFGPISTAQGGDILAQVLATSRGDLTVVSCVHPGDFDRERFSGTGPQMLLDLLAQAEAYDHEAQAGTWPTTEARPHQLLIDLADRLFNTGLNVIANVGVEGGMRIPLAIGHPELPGELLVAILTDNDEYVCEPSLRRRDRHWPAMLESLGWKTRTELSMAVFIDPQKEADDIVELVLDAVDERCAQDPKLAAAIEQRYYDSISQDASDTGEAGGGADSADVSSHSHTSAEDGHAGSAMTPSPSEDDTEDEAAENTSPGFETEEERWQRGIGDSDIHGEEVRVRGETVWQDPGQARGPRPQIATGLPLAAYSDDQLDEMARWIRSDGVPRDEDEMIDQLQAELALTRRGAQVEAVLRHVARRTSEQ